MRRLVVIVPTPAHLATAGVRIRYKRLASKCKEHGLDLQTAIIDDVKACGSKKDDIFLFSKCTDARAVLLAKRLRAPGCHIGIDLFDDYFSQSDDSRLVHQRRWLADILPLIDFVTCATPAMAARLREINVKVPLHVINDPFENWNPSRALELVRFKLDEVRLDRILRTCWFGMGQNDFFPIGLDDLFAFSDVLARLGRSGMKVSLDVLTNAKALDADTLAALSRLPVETIVREWSLSREAELLTSSHVAFIPVNAQPFSTVKSLNRAVTALTHGAQVLTAGYPLYAALDRFVYTSALEFLADVERGALRVSEATIDDLDATLTAIAHPSIEAAGLAAFLKSLPVRPSITSALGPQAVLHGAKSQKSIHDFAKRAGDLSVGSPFAMHRGGLDLTVEVDEVVGLPVLAVSKRAEALLSNAARERLKTVRTRSGRTVMALPLPARLRYAATATSAEMAALYNENISIFSRALCDAIPGLSLVLSETQSALWTSSAELWRELEPSGTMADREAAAFD